MIELEVNGHRQNVEPSTTQELRSLVEKQLPSGHVIRRIDVNGGQFDEAKLEEVDLTRLNTVTVQSSSTSAVAYESLAETSEWIGRICGVLAEIAEDYRLGRTAQGTGRLVDVVDALQVLVPLLSGINKFIEIPEAERSEFECVWSEAEKGLCSSIEGLFEELKDADPVLLADRTGYTLPAALKHFQEVLDRP
ncbi:MAG: hypothetical protein GY725_02710 [bacterium]|nr:hypothetical protein [bacterium]